MRAISSGDHDRAIQTAATAAEYEASLPVDFGPPIAFKPSRELRADLLLAAGRADDALAASRTQLGLSTVS